jgi:hypothetical protein
MKSGGAICLFFLFVLQIVAFAQSSVLSTGNWVKLSIAKEGVYKITYQNLKDYGFEPDKINPNFIKLHGYGGGMLPQANSTTRPYDLPEVAIWVNGEADGKFDSQDVIYFFAKDADKWTLNSATNLYECEKNLYDESNYYFLTLGEAQGKRVSNSSFNATPDLVITSVDKRIHYEKDFVNVLRSGRS